MRVLRLSLTDWRNYATAEVRFEPGPNVLAGSNGQGKTNLVEAIGYLTTLGSHRVTGDAALIRAGEESAVIRATVLAADREMLAEVLLNRSGRNRAQLNRSAVRPREVTRAVSSVLFAPEDLAIVRGEPSARRRFVDELLVQRSPRMAGVLGDYDKALRQRNGLLRHARGGVDPQSLDAWDERLVAAGAEVLDARTGLLADLEPLVAEQYAVVAGTDQRVTATAQRSIDAEGAEGPTAERFADALRAVRRRELERGLTLVGPHRDDVLLTVNDLPARGYASHGESWSLALALRLGSVELLRHGLPTGDPVVILDDVFAELDAERRRRLAERVLRYEQVIVTAAVEEDVPAALAGRVTRIRSGRVLDDGEGRCGQGRTMTDPGPTSEPQRVWARLRGVFGAPRPRARPREQRPGGTPFAGGRDPLAVGSVLDGVTDALGWRTPLAQTDLVAAWRSIAGEETARHAEVEGFADGVLLVRCDSTAWATQLSLMRPQIAERIARDFPQAGVAQLRFLGPNTPSWNHGPRSVPGRGPRDTYG